jgi:hypothetical protein
MPLSPKKISNYLPPVKDAVELKTPGIYSILVSAGRYTSDKAAGLHRSGLKKTKDI